MRSRSIANNYDFDRARVFENMQLNNKTQPDGRGRFKLFAGKIAWRKMEKKFSDLFWAFTLLYWNCVLYVNKQYSVPNANVHI